MSMSEENTDKQKIPWVSTGTQIRDSFSCLPQPEISGHTRSESVLLKDSSQLIDLMIELKERQQFESLNLINAIEYKEAVQVIYQLISFTPKYTILSLKVNLPRTEDLIIPSVSSVWDSANWFEREIYDMHGIVFEGHPNLKRILNPQDWEGFPLQKNYLPPLDALNGPISAVKENMQPLAYSTRQENEFEQK